MSGSYSVRMGDRGRLVVPAELRQRAGLDEGRSLVLLEADHGIVLLTREQMLVRVRRDLRDGLADRDPVAELLAERRMAAEAEDAAAAGAPTSS